MKSILKKWFYRHIALFIFVLLLIVSLLMIFFSRPFYRQGTYDLGQAIVSLFQNLVHKGEEQVDSMGIHLLSKKQLLKENQQLKESIASLESQLAGYATLEQEYYLIQELNNQHKLFLEFNQFRVIPAQIINFTSDSTSPSFLIDVGKKKGVVKNAPIVAIQNNRIALVGKVIHSNYFTSTVRPLFHSLSSMGVRLEKGRYEGLLTGSGYYQKDLKLSHVNREAQKSIQYGDRVFTSGLSSLYPAGLLVGTITGMKKDIKGPTVELSVKPYITFETIETLFVLIKEDFKEPDQEIFP